jgi:hypothetical protein
MSDTPPNDTVPTDTLAEGEATGDARSAAVREDVDARLDVDPGDAAGAGEATPDDGTEDLSDSGTGPREADETVSADDLTELQDDPTAVEPTD